MKSYERDLQVSEGLLKRNPDSAQACARCDGRSLQARPVARYLSQFDWLCTSERALHCSMR